MAATSTNLSPATFRLSLTDETPAATESHSRDALDLSILRCNAVWFCKLRWIVVAVLAVVGAVSLWSVLSARAGLMLNPAWPLATAGILFVCNLAYLALLPAGESPRGLRAIRANVWGQILGDLIVLTWVVHCLGSVETQASNMYLFHIILSCIFLTRAESLGVVFMAAALYLSCLALEAAAVLPANTVLSGLALPTRAEPSPVSWTTHLGFTLGIWGIIWYLASRLSNALRLRERELAATNARLEASVDERMRHMLQTTHQLKAPFAAIHANAQLLQGGYCGELSDRIQGVLDRIACRCGLLSQQIVEMLQLANLRSGGQTAPPRQPLDVAQVVRTCAARVEPNGRQRGIRIDTDLQPARVLAVEDHLKMLVDNLLTNAVNYSHDGGTVRASCRTDPHGCVVLEVCDEGIGIPPEKLPQIFGDYFRTREAVEHNHASTGLGLAIVRDVARSARIEVEVESTPGRGTRFTLKIPTGPAAPDKTV